MARYSSDSDSDSGRKRSSKKGKKKTRSRKRSRSSSSDRQRSRDSRRRSRSRSRDSRRRSISRSRDSRRRSRSRSRSRSDDSYYSRRKRSTSRSRGRRSRSRSSSRERYSRRRRSRSRSREKSRKRGERSRNRSHSRERSVPKKKSQPPKPTVVKQKDPCEDIPGFAEMTPAQQNRLRMQAAFKALDTEKVVETTAVPTPAAAETTLEHMERAQVIADIEDEGFMPTHFSSTRSTKTAEPPKTSWPTNLADQEDYHEMAIFGHSGALALDEKSKKQISDAAGAIIPRKTLWKDRDPKSLAHPNLHISKEEADRRWFEYLTEMRKQQALQAVS